MITLQTSEQRINFPVTYYTAIKLTNATVIMVIFKSGATVLESLVKTWITKFDHKLLRVVVVRKYEANSWKQLH